MSAPADAYDFGGNWRTFIDRHLTDERIEEAERSLLEFLKVDSLKGKTFLDIGCGSGLFSLAAHRLGAERVVSFDVNEKSVACCEELRRSRGSHDGWEITYGSVLDEAWVRKLGEFDIVYSWGVLHHTGSMWEAIKNASTCVAPGGLFYIAIYNKADGIGIYSDGRVGSSRLWEFEKKAYVAMPEWGKRALDGAAAAGMIAGYLATARNPVREIKGHKTLRGMSWMVDIRDWLGGHPYEYATPAEIFNYCHGELGFSLENMWTTNSLRNNEFLFQRKAS